jgi:putative hemolysin
MMLYVELALVLGLVLVNGVLAMSELAVVSSRPARLRALAEQGVKGAKRALALASDPGRFLSTVQVGITLVGILAGAFSGATLGERLDDYLRGLGMPAQVSNPLAFGGVVVVITYLSLIVGELVPKQIALRDPERVACGAAPAMMLLARIGTPLVWLLDRSGRLVLWLLGQGGEKEIKVSDEEIRSLIAEAETAGVIEPEERQMIAGVMRLGDRSVAAVMTPRGEVDMIDIGEGRAKVLKRMSDSIHSRFPAYDGSRDEVVGVLQAKDIAAALASRAKLDLPALVRKAPIIPPSLDALDVVELLKDSPIHMGLVHDEYGHFLGVVTSADILEAIVGEFRSEEGAVEPDLVRREDGSYLIAGDMPADEFAEALGLRLPERRDYHTVAGFVLDRLAHLPSVGETFDAHGWRFEVIDLDGRRIDKVLAQKRPNVHRASLKEPA